ncbi:unnamed protein product, partial [Symbiodinium sp. KB8]
MDAQAERRTDRLEEVATPLRRRAQSPVPATPQPVSQKGSRLPAAARADPDFPPQEKIRRTTSGQRFGLVAGVAMLAFACLRPCWLSLTRGMAKPDEDANATITSLATVEREPEAGPSYPQLIDRALDCPTIRADVLDVLAGAPYEFSAAAEEQGFYRLPRMAAAAATRDEDAPLPQLCFTVAALPGLCRFVLSADASALVPASRRCRAERLVPRRLAEELVGDEPLDIEVDLVLDKKVFCTLRSSKAIFDAAPELGSLPPDESLRYVALLQRRFIVACSGIEVSSIMSGVGKVQTLVERACTEGCAAEAASLPSLSPFCWQVLALFNDRGVLRQGPAMDPADHGAGKERDAAAEGRRLVALLPDDEASGEHPAQGQQPGDSNE